MASTQGPSVPASERVEHLAARLRSTLLVGQRKRATQEVEEWGRSHTQGLEGDRLLAAYNEAVSTSETDARVLLEEEVLSSGGKPVVIGLLNRQGTADQERILALQVLLDVVDGDDVAELARVSAKQRAAALPRTLEVFAAAKTPEAAFVLTYLFGDLDEPERSQAHTLARQLTEGSAETQALREAGGSDIDAVDLLYTALAKDPRQRAELRSLKGTEAARRIAAAADRLDGELIEAGRRPSGLNDYESILRRELHTLVLLADLAVEEQLRARALDTFFSSDLGHVQATAPHLPPAPLANYVDRALTQVNRRKRPDRARLALSLIAQLPAQERQRVRNNVNALLDDAEPESRLQAGLALVSSFGDLTTAERQALPRVLDELPPALRNVLAPRLGALSEELAAQSELSSFLQWAASAPDDEVDQRCSAVLERWTLSELSIDEVTAVVTVVGALLERTALGDRGSLQERLAKIAGGWLRQQGGTAAATRGLLSWRGFPAVTLAQFPTFANALTARGARRLLSEVVAPRGQLAPELAGAAAGLNLPSERSVRLVLPVLAAHAGTAPVDYSSTFAQASDLGRRRLLAGGLLAHRSAISGADDIETALSQKSTEALVRRRDRVLRALEQAEDESVENEGLVREFEAIRRALALEDAPDGGPSEDVRTWRIAAAERYPSLVEAPAEGHQMLRVPPDGNSIDDLMALMSELDRRANARGTVPAADRAHYRQDLHSCAVAFVARGLLEREREAGAGAAARRSSELTRLLEALWAKGLGARLGDELESALAGASDGSAGRESLRLVDALAKHADHTTIERAAADLPSSALDAAWQKTMVVLAASVRRREQLKTQAKRHEREAMTRIASRLQLPFQAIESYLFGYFRLRQILAEAGWARVEPHLGAELARGDLNPESHEIRGDEQSGDTFVVRSLGISVLGQPVRRAIIEPLKQPESLEEAIEPETESE